MEVNYNTKAGMSVLKLKAQGFTLVSAKYVQGTCHQRKVLGVHTNGTVYRILGFITGYRTNEVEYWKTQKVRYKPDGYPVTYISDRRGQIMAKQFRYFLR